MTPIILSMFHKQLIFLTYFLIIVEAENTKDLHKTKDWKNRYFADYFKPRQSKIILVRDIYENGFSPKFNDYCDNEGEYLKLIVVILSDPINFHARNSIRDTWSLNHRDIQFNFLFGSHTDPWIEKLLSEEKTIHNDIIRGKFLDSYSNFTLKTVSAFEWVNAYCSKAKFMLKVHDNVFVNIPYLITFVRTHMDYENAIFAKFNDVNSNLATNYSTFLKDEEISNSTDAVLNGHTYLLSTDTVKKLYNQTLKMRINEIEDRFLTSTIAQELEINRFNVIEFSCSSQNIDPCTINRCISVNNVKPVQHRDLWKKLFTCSKNCSHYRCLRSQEKSLKSNWTVTLASLTVLYIVNLYKNIIL